MEYYFAYSFFRVDSKWRWMADLAKEESAKELYNILENTGLRYRTYSTLGTRAEADLMVWFAAETIEQIQEALSKVYLAIFGKYLVPSLSYLSCTRDSTYAQGSPKMSFLADAAPKKYAIVYPFTKTREWYLLPAEQRQRMMEQHIAVGKKYPAISLNTTYSFGLHDADFMLAFECDDLREFQNLIVELRETMVSKYVKSDTPMIVCVKKDIIPLISSLG